MKQNSQKIIRGRLARIQGQVRGLTQMIEDGRESADVLTQLSAVRAALDSVGSIVISDHVEDLAGSKSLDPETCRTLGAMIKTFLR